MTDLLCDGDFPAHTVHPDRVLFRIHRWAHDPVHFASDHTGRFNLTTVAGSGTCYLSPSAMGAYVEVFGRLGTIRTEDVVDRALSELTLSRPLRLADVTDRQILGRYHLSGEISAGLDYDLTQRFASEAYTAGFEGVYYTARHDPAFQERNIAVFGGPEADKLFTATSDDIPPSLVHEGERGFGLLVMPFPT